MRAIEISSFGEPNVLKETTRPDPVAKPGEAMIRVEASGVNRPDVMQRKGQYPPPKGASDLPGLEVAGKIIAGDVDALARAGLKLGDAVCGLVAGGGYAELCVIPISQCLPIPHGLSMLEAAALPENFFTVWSNIFDRGHLKAGETILVHGGSSGIGVTTIQLAKAFGAKVIVTVGNGEKCEACRKLGADHAINYRTSDFVAETKRLTNGRGADVILDMVAGDYIARDVQCLADDGRILIIANLGGAKAEFDAGEVLRRRLTITGQTLRPRPEPFKAAIGKQLREHVWPLIAAGQVRPIIAKVFPAGQAAEAHALMESSQHIGKIMLDWTA